jgi:hypothetical protein
MSMAPDVRRFTLTAHVVSSVGWLGAAGVYLTLAVAVVASRDLEIVRTDYLTMKLIVWWVLVPLSVASLVTGIAAALGTRWALLQHYWVLFKLVLNLIATGVLMAYMRVIGEAADAAAGWRLGSSELDVPRSPTHVVHTGIGLHMLLAATVLSIYKPRGLTRYGQRMRQRRLHRLRQPS